MSSTFNNLFIFEMANNHQGDVDHGRKIISMLAEVAREHRIKAAVKFQYRNLDTFIHPDYKYSAQNKHIQRFLSTQITHDQFYSMVKDVKEDDMISICTPFDEDSVALCLDHGIEILKVASCSATDWPLLEAVAASKRPVIISTGGKTFKEIDNIYNFMVHRDVNFALMHCVGIYPVMPEEVQLNCIEKMKKRYPGVTIGYSGHEEPKNMLIPSMAVAKGAQIFERHVGLATETVKLNAYSSDVREIGEWVSAVKNAIKICGDINEKHITQKEFKAINELTRGCYAAVRINKGDIINRGMVFYAMPCADGQTTSGQFEDGMVASVKYEPCSAIYEKRREMLTKDIRSLIHDIKSMLYEARVIIGSNFELELSHHYGLEHFRNYGAAIVNIINREYCKKLIVILPGQKHPMHYHKIKEESFHVLDGQLELSLGPILKTVCAGEVITVERGIEHAFTSETGCIFEEVSTTHVGNDSYYNDEEIMKIDPLNRKTILTEW